MRRRDVRKGSNWGGTAGVGMKNVCSGGGALIGERGTEQSWGEEPRVVAGVDGGSITADCGVREARAGVGRGQMPSLPRRRSRWGGLHKTC